MFHSIDFNDLGNKAKQIEMFMLNKAKMDDNQTKLLIQIRDSLLEMDKTLSNLVKMLLIKEEYFPKG
jgi:hypothetical protein